MKIKKLQYQFDKDLNPSNAEEKGYRFVDDIPDLYKILEDVLMIASENGYVLGGSKEFGRVGLYQKKE